MAAYRQRLAERIDQELQRRGEDHTDLAYALKVSPRTAERWIAGATEPQRRLRKPIADYFGASIEDFWPDLQSEERALRDQLDRIEAGQLRTEAKLNVVLAELIDGRLDEEAVTAEVERATADAAERHGTRSGSSATSAGAPRRARRAG